MQINFDVDVDHAADIRDALNGLCRTGVGLTLVLMPSVLASIIDSGSDTANRFESVVECPGHGIDGVHTAWKILGRPGDQLRNKILAVSPVTGINSGTDAYGKEVV